MTIKTAPPDIISVDSLRKLHNTRTTPHRTVSTQGSNGKVQLKTLGPVGSCWDPVDPNRMLRSCLPTNQFTWVVHMLDDATFCCTVAVDYIFINMA